MMRIQFLVSQNFTFILIYLTEIEFSEAKYQVYFFVGVVGIGSVVPSPRTIIISDTMRDQILGSFFRYILYIYNEKSFSIRNKSENLTSERLNFHMNNQEC